MGAQAVRLSNIDIDNAFENRDFEVLFQPIFHLGNGSLARMESFIRWRHPNLGVLPPGAFISFFESQGRMSELSRYVLDEAFRNYLEWRGNYGPGFSINLALTDLHDDVLASHLTVLLREYNFPANEVTLECPMPPVTMNENQAKDQFLTLKETGARLAIEVRGRANDFIRNVSPFPFDEIKTGGAAILRFARTVRGPGLSAISELLDIAKDNNCTIAAVGVEDQASLSALCGLGFNAAQGNHLGKVGALNDFKSDHINIVRERLELPPLTASQLNDLFRTHSGALPEALDEQPINDEVAPIKASTETNTKAVPASKPTKQETTAERARRKAAILARRKGGDVLRAELAARRAKLGLGFSEQINNNPPAAARGLQDRLSTEFISETDEDDEILSVDYPSSDAQKQISSHTDDIKLLSSTSSQEEVPTSEALPLLEATPAQDITSQEINDPDISDQDIDLKDIKTKDVKKVKNKKKKGKKKNKPLKDTQIDVTSKDITQNETAQDEVVQDEVVTDIAAQESDTPEFNEISEVMNDQQDSEIIEDGQEDDQDNSVEYKADENLDESPKNKEEEDKESFEESADKIAREEQHTPIIEAPLPSALQDNFQSHMRIDDVEAQQIEMISIYVDENDLIEVGTIEETPLNDGIAQTQPSEDEQNSAIHDSIFLISPDELLPKQKPRSPSFATITAEQQATPDAPASDPQTKHNNEPAPSEKKDTSSANKDTSSSYKPMRLKIVDPKDGAQDETLVTPETLETLESLQSEARQNVIDHQENDLSDKEKRAIALKNSLLGEEDETLIAADNETAMLEESLILTGTAKAAHARRKNFLQRKYRIWPTHFWPRSWTKAWDKRAENRDFVRRAKEVSAGLASKDEPPINAEDVDHTALENTQDRLF